MAHGNLQGDILSTKDKMAGPKVKLRLLAVQTPLSEVSLHIPREVRSMIKVKQHITIFLAF